MPRLPEPMDSLLAGIESVALVQYLRFGQWGYAAVNTAHVLGIALLIGAIVPLDLRLLGLWPSVPRAPLVRVLVPAAAAGLTLAVAAGILLFAVRAREYAAHDLMLVKLALIATGTAAALMLHRAHGFLFEEAGRGRVATHAALSMTCWIGALVCGRLIGFTN